MVPSTWSLFLIVAATHHTGSCQDCPVGAPLKGCEGITVGHDRPWCPVGYYCRDLMMNNLGACCRNVCWDGPPITDNNGRAIDCSRGRKELCPEATECVRTRRNGTRSFCCNIRVTIG